jgi:hypothetical protein
MPVRNITSGSWYLFIGFLKVQKYVEVPVEENR